MPLTPIADALPETFTITLGGAVLDPILMMDFRGARVSSARSIADRAELRFSDNDFELMNDDTKFVIGKEIQVEISTVGGPLTEVFKGEITAIGVDQGEMQTSQLVIEAYDKSHRLGHTSRVRTFLKMTYGDMIAKIAQEAGLTAKTTTAVSGSVFDYTMQNSTDFAFLDTIALRTGTDWFVKDNGLYFEERGTPQAVATLEGGTNLRKFRARYSGSEHVTKATVRSWDPTTKKAISSVDSTKVVNPASASKPKLATDGRAAAKKNFGSPAYATGALVAETQKEADTIVGALGARQAMSELIVKGEVAGVPVLKAGALVTIKNVGKSLSGDYFLTEVEHVIANGALISRFTAGGLEHSAIVDLLGGGDVGPWGKEGLVIGLVTNNKDPEGLSRVKVKFPTLSDNEESNWARIVSVGAGGGRGWHMIPEVDDEVVVGFEHGDLRRPFVLGSVWNTKDKPPMANDDVVGTNVGSWTIKTRQGLVLGLLDGDSPDKKAMSLVLSDGKTKLLVAEDKIQVITDQKPIELNTGQSSIVMAANGDITIDAVNVTIKAKSNIKLDAKAGVEAKGLTVKMEAQTSFEAKGNATAKVEASGPLTLKGAIAMIN